MQIANLTCEFSKNPLVIESKRPRFCWNIQSEEYNLSQEDYQIIVSSSRDNIALNKGEMWDSGTVKSGNSLCVVYDGKELECKKTYYWQVRAHTNTGCELISEIASFGTGLSDSDWSCSFIGQSADEMKTYPESVEARAGAAAPYLRKTFETGKEIKSAKAFATAYGIYELYINGSKANDCRLSPGWTDYSKSLQYHCFDVTEFLRAGKNAVGAVLGDGWFFGNVAVAGRNCYGDYPLGFRMHLLIEYSDGTNQIVVTDETWKTANGPIIYSDLQSGEYYDGTKELEGWCLPDYLDSDWKAAVSVSKFSEAKLKAAISPPVREIMELKPKQINSYEDKLIVDLGQNMVGVVKLFLKAKRGDKIVLRFGEMLNQDGSLYTENLRTSLQTDTYIAKGDPSGEEFEPRFTIHGFRFFELSGLSYIPSQEDIIARVIHTDCEITGEITTSSELINKLFSNQLWGQRGNFVSIPTDCPQRDERMGWTGDAQIFAGTACYNMDCAGLYEKYMQDCVEAQKQNGAITDVAPMVKVTNDLITNIEPMVKAVSGNDLVGCGTAAWGDVIYILPWVVYNRYADINILEDNYESMLKYFTFLEGTANNYIRPDSGYGDWLNVNSDTPRDVLSTAYFAYAAKIIGKIAAVLGKDEDVKRFSEVFEKIKAAFNDAFVDDDVIIKGDTQCCYVLALKMELLNSEARQMAVSHLIRTIESKDWHISTGFVGISYIAEVLTENGFADVAYKFLLNETYPSWGYSIKNGATTIWERWNSYTAEDGFGDVGMNSFNHYSLGSVAEWMYRYIGGIQELEPGFKRFKIMPVFSEKLDFARCVYKSASGKITSSWKREKTHLTVTVIVPANTTAEIHLTKVDSVLQGKAELSENDGEGQIYRVGSGEYIFKLSI